MLSDVIARFQLVKLALYRHITMSEQKVNSAFVDYS